MVPGTVCAFRVKAASAGGWGEASPVAVAKMVDSESSLACQEQLKDQLAGTYISSGTIFAVAGGCVALLLCTCFVVFMMRKRSPPPPPPEEFKSVAPPPPY